MRVFNTLDNVITNVEDDCPSLDWHRENGSEELPVDIFGQYAHMADNTNTKNINGVWTFTPDLEAFQQAEHEAYLHAERQWVSAELSYADVQAAYHQDSDRRASSTLEAWSRYRTALRDYVSHEGVVLGNRPERPTE